MNRPGLMTYAAGNNAVCATVQVFAGLEVWHWWRGELAWLPALISAMVAFAALRAYREIRAFNAWEREWNTLSGVPLPAAPSIRNKPWAATVWVVLLILVVTHPFESADATGMTAAGFVLVSLWITGRFLWRVARGARDKSQAAQATEAPRHVVQVCLPVARRSPRPEEVTAALPDYCKALLRASSRADGRSRVTA